MINFCIFVFILYAMSYSVRVILFGSKRKQQRRRKPRRNVNLAAKRPCVKVRLQVKSNPTTASGSENRRMAA